MKYALLISFILLLLFCHAQTEKVFTVSPKPLAEQGVHLFPEIDTLNAGATHAFNILGMDINNVEATVTGATYQLTNKSIWITSDKFSYPEQQVLLQLRDKRDRTRQVLYQKTFFVVPLRQSSLLGGPYAGIKFPVAIYLDNILLYGQDTIDRQTLGNLQSLKVGLGTIKPASYKILIGSTVKLQASDGKLTPQMKDALAKLKPGDKFSITEIKYRINTDSQEQLIGPFEIVVRK